MRGIDVAIRGKGKEQAFIGCEVIENGCEEVRCFCRCAQIFDGKPAERREAQALIARISAASRDSSSACDFRDRPVDKSIPPPFFNRISLS
jgi:hypothetical protein